MKLTILALTLVAGIAMANDTVSMDPADEKRCRERQVFEGSPCCTYSDCQGCGFQQRCCLRYGSEPRDAKGQCMCGVNKFPQGTCF